MPNFIEASDFLNKARVLRQTSVNREYFDPTNEAHLESLKLFIDTGNWGKVQFFCEFPFIEVPMTVLVKFAGHHLGAARETATERLMRFAAKHAPVDVAEGA